MHLDCLPQSIVSSICVSVLLPVNRFCQCRCTSLRCRLPGSVKVKKVEGSFLLPCPSKPWIIFLPLKYDFFVVVDELGDTAVALQAIGASVNIQEMLSSIALWMELHFTYCQTAYSATLACTFPLHSTSCLPMYHSKLAVMLIKLRNINFKPDLHVLCVSDYGLNKVS